MKTTAALSYEQTSLLRAIRDARPCEQATIVNLEDRTRRTVEDMMSRGLVVEINGVPRLTDAGKAALA